MHIKEAVSVIQDILDEVDQEWGRDPQVRDLLVELNSILARREGVVGSS